MVKKLYNNSEEKPLMLSVEGLTKSFGGLIAVNNVTFELKKGEILGLIGANGAGKTTLFNCVTGFLRPTSGTVRYNGEDVTRQKPYVLSRKGLTRTFQVVKPFLQMDVLHNVIVGGYCKESEYKNAYALAEEALELTGLKNRSNDLAKSLTTADRKRMELARALATQPKLLLLDETMGGLRPNEVNDMLVLLKKIRDEKGVSILLIEHIMQAIMNISDRIVVVHHGEKIAEGIPSEIANNPVVIEAYLGGSEKLA